MNVEEILIRQLKLQNDLQEENNKLLREILRVLIKKQLFFNKIKLLEITNYKLFLKQVYELFSMVFVIIIYISDLKKLINVKM